MIDSFTNEFQPVPKEIVDGSQEDSTVLWFQEARDRLSPARTTRPGTVRKMPAQPDATGWTDATAQADFNALLAKLRAAGMMES